ncbi:type II toxin-antitoxin system HicB family antitoxin [Clostridium sulfidigenes]|uniref:type II toxin-antitoxin system HicB family antitoxin n=1 Tax=Clostridium sulfidigenes TaxID=318464 RepID=UPI003F8A04BA
MYENNYIFPAVISFLGEKDYNVRFLDFENITTCGESLADAFDAAEDALKLEIFDLYNDKLEIPESSDVSNIKVGIDETLILVKVNLKEILKQYDNKAIKKTLTIPSWLNKMAEDEKVNCSQILQEALKEKFNIN